VCAAIRGTAPFPPQPIVSLSELSAAAPADPSASVEPIEVVCQFESSSKWPDDAVAISRIKTAFYIKIAAELKDKFESPTSVGYAH
jgi:U3 small nucleolar RNA-associated protein 22